MIHEVANKILSEINKQKEIIKNNLTNGNITTFEEYKFLCGKFNGFLETEELITSNLNFMMGTINYI